MISGILLLILSSHKKIKTQTQQGCRQWYPEISALLPFSVAPNKVIPGAGSKKDKRASTHGIKPCPFLMCATLGWTFNCANDTAVHQLDFSDKHSTLMPLAPRQSCWLSSSPVAFSPHITYPKCPKAIPDRHWAGEGWLNKATTFDSLDLRRISGIKNC